MRSTFTRSICTRLALAGAGLLVALVLATSSRALAANEPQVAIETNLGTIVIKLYGDKAPGTVKNFLEYVDAKHYDGLVFHRVIRNFMIQGGGFDKDLKSRQPRSPIQNEANNGLKNKRGTLSMARTSDPNSATSQFFVNLVDNQSLDNSGTSPERMGYCVFGEVVSGMDVVDKIANVDTCPQSGSLCTAPLPPGMRDVPAQPVIIKSARRK